MGLHDRIARQQQNGSGDGAAVTEVAIAGWWRRRLAFAFRFPNLVD